MDAKQIEQKMLEAREKSFHELMSRPEIKMMVSMIPPCPQPDWIVTLLHGAHNHGFQQGEGASMARIVEVIIKAKTQEL